MKASVDAKVGWRDDPIWLTSQQVQPARLAVARDSDDCTRSRRRPAMSASGEPPISPSWRTSGTSTAASATRSPNGAGGSGPRTTMSARRRSTGVGVTSSETTRTTAAPSLRPARDRGPGRPERWSADRLRRASRQRLLDLQPRSGLSLSSRRRALLRNLRCGAAALAVGPATEQRLREQH